MQQRSPEKTRDTRKGRSDNYMEARNAILQRSKQPGAAKHMWLEVAEGAQPEALDYLIHASNDESTVPPFAVEVYRGGLLESYEASRDELRKRSVMPEDLRQRIVQAQRASGLIDRMLSETSPSHAAL